MVPWSRHRRKPLAILVMVWLFVTLRLNVYIPSVKIPDDALTTGDSRFDDYIQERSPRRDLHYNPRIKNEDLILIQNNNETKSADTLDNEGVNGPREPHGSRKSNPEVQEKKESNISETRQDKESNPEMEQNKESNPSEIRQNQESNPEKHKDNKGTNFEMQEIKESSREIQEYHEMQDNKESNREMEESRESNIEMQKNKDSNNELQKNKNSNLEMQENKDSNREIQDNQESNREMQENKETSSEMQGNTDSKAETQENKDSNPGKQENKDSNPERQENKDSNPGKQENKDSNPERQENKDSNPERQEKKDSNPEKQENKDSNLGKQEKKDSNPGKQENKDSNPEKQENKDSNPERQEKKDSNPGKQENKDSNPGKQENKDSNLGKQENKEVNSEAQENKEVNSEAQENKESNTETQNRESNSTEQQQKNETISEIQRNGGLKPTLVYEKVEAFSEAEEKKLKQNASELHVQLQGSETNKSQKEPKKRPILLKLKGPVLSHVIDPSEVLVRQEELSALKARIETLNMEQRIFNAHLFGPVTAKTTILLVQVHRRLEYLTHLVESMREARGINDTLVIFSHDFWDDQINAFVQNISEFRVMQMFFPYSIQLHPSTFPGRDPRDCEWNMPRDSDQDCLNKAWPDKYGHYREPQFTQIKHHWWWKINRVFDVLRVTKNWTGTVLSLEEDHYLLPDTLHVLNLLLHQRSSVCPTCHVMGLGNYQLKKALPEKLLMGDWPVSGYNLGYTLDRDAWETIKKLSDVFCTYDDYNWDLTLSYMVLQHIRPHLGMLRVELSRVAHIGTCGTHFKAATCNIKREIEKVKLRYDTNKLFPKNLVLHGTYMKRKGKSTPSGGWGDVRDIQLCKLIAQEASGANVTAINTEGHR